MITEQLSLVSSTLAEHAIHNIKIMLTEQLSLLCITSYEHNFRTFIPSM